MSDALRWFLASRSAAALTNQMLSLAVGWQIYGHSNSALALGMVGLCQVAPMLALALWTGLWADRADRRLILVITQLAQAGCAFAFYLCTRNGIHSLAPLYAVLVLKGVSQAVQMPAGQAILPSLAPRALFHKAVAWRAMSLELSSILGPLMAGALVASPLGPGSVYLLGALLNVAGALALFRLPPVPRSEVPPPRLLDGIRFLKGQPAILGALTLDLFAVLFGGTTALLPIFARDILHVGPEGLGWLKAAPHIGGLGMFLLMARLPPFSRSGRLLLAAVTLYGGTMIGFGLSTGFLLSVALLALGGAADAISVLIRHTIVQTLTPDALRGRVSAVNGVFFNASNDLGELESGLAAYWLGAAPSVVMGGVLTLLVVAGCARVFPAMRELDRLDGGTAP